MQLLQLELQREEKNDKLIVGLCYRPPNQKDEKESDLVSQLGMEARQGNVTIIGDSNYPDINWTDRTAHSFMACNFLNILQENFMCQLMDASTRSNALLDLIITNSTYLIADMEIRVNLQSNYIQHKF